MDHIDELEDCACVTDEYVQQMLLASTTPIATIVEDPVVAIAFCDGTTTTYKSYESFNPLKGLMVCAFEKVREDTESDMRIGAWMPAIDFLSDFLANAEETGVLVDVLAMVAEALETPGTMERMKRYDVRNKGGAK